jgi:hypothetical protein
MNKENNVKSLRILNSKEITNKNGIIFEQNSIINKQDSYYCNYQNIMVQKRKYNNN